MGREKSEAFKTMTEEDVRALVHELQVHQIELEMQNEELQHAFLEAEELRTKYLDLYDFAPVGYFTLDESGTILEVNLAGAKLLGLERRSLVGRRFQLFVASDARAEFHVFSRRVFESDGKKTGELKLLKDGESPLYALMEGISVTDAQGAGKLMRIAVMDITSRIRAEEELQESEAKYSSLVEQAGDGVLIVQDELIKFANRAFALNHGYTVEEVLGKCFFELMAPECRDESTEKQGRRLTGDKIPNYQTRALCKDGTTRDVEVSTDVILYHGRPAVMGIVRDVTERKKLEEELIKLHKLESIGVLAGGIAHDFNNLLMGVLGNIALAKVSQRLEPDTLERLNRAEKAALQAKHLTARLLTFAKGGAPIRDVVQISELIEEMACFAVRGSNVRCEFFIADDLWPVQVDEGQISQVFNNLALNAQQAMPQGGTIDIRARNVFVEGEEHLPLKAGTYVRISFEDHGIGIPKEDLQRIFDPYFTTKQAGRGLGLTIVYSVIQKHAGYIDVETKPENGTTFHIFLPAAKGVVESRVEEDRHYGLPSGEGKILLMDDDEAVRNVGGEILKHLGYKVGLAGNGAEAVKRYAEARESGQPFDVVILDLTIPGEMGGKETMEKLLKIDPAVRAIVCSGYSNDPIMTEYAKFGFRGVIAKPYEPEELGKTLCRIIAGTEE
ncbi:MAG: PAS domain S-box protein [Pseudomonadota bacterium]